MQKIAVFCGDKGNLINGANPIISELRRRDAHVTVYLDPAGTATQIPDSYKVDLTTYYTDIGMPYVGANVRGVDKVLVTLSAGASELEREAVGVAKEMGKLVFGIEEMIGGRNNPRWMDGNKPTLMLDRLFSIMPTDDDHLFTNVQVVGPLALERYRGVPTSLLEEAGRAGFNHGQDSVIDHLAPHIVVALSPERESRHALRRIGQVLLQLHSRGGLSQRSRLVVIRHGRELMTPVPGNVDGYYDTMDWIEKHLPVSVIDHSEGFSDKVSERFGTRSTASYQQLLCATSRNGVFITFFGTDGAVVAPHLADKGIVSILYLDPEFGGAVLKREKGMDRLPLPGVWQAFDDSDLYRYLLYALDDDFSRRQHCEHLAKLYPFPDKDPAQTVADVILS